MIQSRTFVVNEDLLTVVVLNGQGFNHFEGDIELLSQCVVHIFLVLHSTREMFPHGLSSKSCSETEAAHK